MNRKKPPLLWGRACPCSPSDRRRTPSFVAAGRRLVAQGLAHGGGGERRDGAEHLELTRLELEESRGLLDVWAEANAFCHQMVRSLVGYLFDVGRGFSDAAGSGEVLAARDRSAVATVAPPHGLTLWEVKFDGAGPN